MVKIRIEIGNRNMAKLILTHDFRYDGDVTFTFTRANPLKDQEPTFERNLDYEQFKALLTESNKSKEDVLPANTSAVEN